MDPAAAAAALTPGAAPVGAAAHPVERLMRDRAALVADVAAGRDVASIARAMLITIAAGGALFGAAIGSYRGGVQIAYAAIKLPLVLLLTAALAAPALTAFNVALDRPARLTRDLALALCALALGGLALAAQAPLILVARALEVSYHQTTLLVVGCSALAGAVSLVFLLRGLRLQAGFGALTVAGLLCAVTILVGGQLAWTLRPYLVRPRAVDVPFLRDPEGGLVEAVRDTMRSIQGDYRRDYAPLPGEPEAGIRHRNSDDYGYTTEEPIKEETATATGIGTETGTETETETGTETGTGTATETGTETETETGTATETGTGTGTGTATETELEPPRSGP